MYTFCYYQFDVDSCYNFNSTQQNSTSIVKFIFQLLCQHLKECLLLFFKWKQNEICSLRFQASTKNYILLHILHRTQKVLEETSSNYM